MMWEEEKFVSAHTFIAFLGYFWFWMLDIEVARWNGVDFLVPKHMRKSKIGILEQIWAKNPYVTFFWVTLYTIPNTSPPPLLHQIIIHFAPARAAATKMQLCMYTKVSLSLKPRWWCDILWCIYGSRMPIFPREGRVAELVRSKARRIYVLSKAFRFDMCARKNPIEFRKTKKN